MYKIYTGQKDPHLDKCREYCRQTKTKRHVGKRQHLPGKTPLKISRKALSSLVVVMIGVPSYSSKESSSSIGRQSKKRYLTVVDFWLGFTAAGAKAEAEAAKKRVEKAENFMVDYLFANNFKEER